VRGEQELINLNPENPHCQLGSIHKLVKLVGLDGIKYLIIRVHKDGNGNLDNLEMLKKDIDNISIKYKVVEF
jgi:hypothetical protein